MQRITDERKCIISGNEILKMHYLFIGNADIFMCRNLILNKVFENGIQICSGKKKCTEIKLSDAEVSEIWIPFAKDLVDIITCIGVAPIRTKKIDNRTNDSIYTKTWILFDTNYNVRGRHLHV